MCYYDTIYVMYILYIYFPRDVAKGTYFQNERTTIFVSKMLLCQPLKSMKFKKHLTHSVKYIENQILALTQSEYI